MPLALNIFDIQSVATSNLTKFIYMWNVFFHDVFVYQYSFLTRAMVLLKAYPPSSIETICVANIKIMRKC